MSLNKDNNILGVQITIWVELNRTYQIHERLILNGLRSSRILYSQCSVYLRRQYIFFDIYVLLFGHLFNIFCEIDSDTRRRYYLLYVCDVEYYRMRPTEKFLLYVQYLVVIVFLKNNFNWYMFLFYQKIKYIILSIRHNSIILLFIMAGLNTYCGII